ncbi:NifU family protein [Isoptericola sp. b441]|uniref:NifU family protein n=1 Tax=Actinotalea lenta TaxID=3064654 RepID=A0ABT9DDQ9_9CELL|nr:MULTISPECIES: NifU family protein [unclassified Isoptericola]MDO8107458.1 NifU family protein [Isoptericola sp. b441]MDO8120881.1 NifU family protein [Isoptericola sp. b490]
MTEAVHPERTDDPTTLLWRFGQGLDGVAQDWDACVRAAFAPLVSAHVVGAVRAERDAVRVTLRPGHSWTTQARQVRTAAQRAAALLRRGAADADSRRRALEAAARDALDQVIGPYAAGHGGDVRLVDVGPDVVSVRLAGACHGCPAAALTVHARLEGLIRRRAPWLAAVEVVDAQPSGWLARVS